MGVRLLTCLGFCYMALNLQAQTFVGTPVNSRNNIQLDQQFTAYEVFALEADAVDEYLRQEAGPVPMQLEFGTDHRWELELQPVSLLSPNYSVRIATSGGIIQQTDTQQVLTYKGKVAGESDSQVRLTVNGNFIYGYVRRGEETYFVEPSNRFSPTAAENHYVIYEASDALPVEGVSCSALEVEEHHLEPHHNEGGSRVNDVYVELAIASDYLMYVDYGTVDDVTQHNIGVLNNVAGDYDGEVFNNDINFVIVEQFVSTCSTCDPWTSNTAAGSLLSSFADWGNNGGFSVADFDLAQLWTDRNLNGTTVGIAYIGAVCSSFKYQVLQDYTSNATSLRVLTSHETGHNFGATHNYAIGSACASDPMRGPLIMDPTVSTATDWSTGLELCVDKFNGSITEINDELASILCLSSTAPSICAAVTDFTIDNITATSITVSWANPGGSVGYRVRLREEGAGSYLVDQSTLLTSITLTPPLSLCTSYEISVENHCSGSNYSDPVIALFSSPSATDFNITDVSTTNCAAGTPNGTYDLTVTFTHLGGNGDGFNINVNGSDYPFSFGASPQTETISGLIGDGTLDNTVTIAAVTNGGGACDATAVFDEPQADCGLFVRENFDDCLIPDGWVGTTSNPLIFTNPYEWKVDGTARISNNYGSSTINDNCMLYFDDDVNSNSFFTGIIEITTEIIDITSFENTELSFIYNFHDFEDGKTPAQNSGNSQFTVEVWDGSAWQTVLTDNDDVCGWFNVWQASCYESPSINLDAYRNADFQVRFSYTDGDDGSYTGMIALDDYLLTGDLSGALPVDLISFTGKAVEEGVLLDWRTATEVNADYFEIQHSLDGRHYEPIGKAAAVGNAQTVQSYAFLHDAPAAGVNYYRLTLYNVDQSYTHEGVVTVTMQKGQQLIITPNPVSAGHFSFVWNSGHDDRLQTQIYNLNGQVLRMDQFDLAVGSNQLKIENLGLPGGIYILRASQSNQDQVVRFVVP